MKKLIGERVPLRKLCLLLDIATGRTDAINIMSRETDAIIGKYGVASNDGGMCVACLVFVVSIVIGSRAATDRPTVYWLFSRLHRFAGSMIKRLDFFSPPPNIVG